LNSENIKRFETMERKKTHGVKRCFSYLFVMDNNFANKDSLTRKINGVIIDIKE